MGILGAGYVIYVCPVGGVRTDEIALNGFPSHPDSDIPGKLWRSRSLVQRVYMTCSMFGGKDLQGLGGRHASVDRFGFARSEALTINPSSSVTGSKCLWLLLPPLIYLPTCSTHRGQRKPARI